MYTCVEDSLYWNFNSIFMNYFELFSRLRDHTRDFTSLNNNDFRSIKQKREGSRHFVQL